MISVKSLEHVGKMYVGPNNGGIINVTELFPKDVFYNQVFNVFNSYAFRIPARVFNEVPEVATGPSIKQQGTRQRFARHSVV